jgi:hypothetical protein
MSSNRAHSEVYTLQLYVIKKNQWLVAGRRFSPGTPVSRCISITETSRWTSTLRDSSETSNGSLVDFLSKLKNRSLYFYDLIRWKMSRNCILSVTELRYLPFLQDLSHLFIRRSGIYKKKNDCSFHRIYILKRRFHHIVCLISSI